MNDTHEFESNDNQRLIDRLVDGELSEHERQTLLESLDTTLDGWRRCALTFLEAQELQRVLPKLPTEDLAEPTGSVSVASKAPRDGSILSLGRVLSIAASVMVGLTLGLVLRGTGHSNENATAPAIVDATPANEAPSEEVQVAEQPPQSPSVAEEAPAESDTPANEQPNAEAPQQRLPVWRNVALAMHDTESETPLEWPMAEGDEVDLQWLYSQPSALSDDMVQQIQQLGHEVNVVRELFPVRLEDGRQGIVPIDRVELRYVGNTMYQ